MSDGAAGQRWQRLTELFDRLVELPAGDRAAHLTELCGDDPSLRAEIESLLAESDGAGLLDAPASDVLATFLEEIGEAVPEQPVGTRVGAYRLVEELGRGGMGVVYLAERVDGQFEQRVALKLVKRGLDTDEVLARFRRERQILARLDHRSIAKLFDGGATEDGRPYFAMEHVVGEPITAWCDAQRLSIDERLRLFRRVCDAVHHAHRHLVVHRDLKPSNILVTEEGDLKLLDFGVAKLLGSGAEDGQDTPTLARVGLRAMTPEYAAPEQVLGGPVSTATDVYALGVVLYELLTGRRPYRLGQRFGAEAERTILEVEPERPSAVVEAGTEDENRSAEGLAHARGLSPSGLRRRLAGDLDAIVLTALRKEPERRYGSAQALSEDIDRHLSGQPVTTRPEGWSYRARKFVRRHRIGVVAASAVLVLAVSAAVVSERGRRAARRELIDGYVTKGMELAQAGDAFGALPWLARALEREPDAAARELDRLRIGTLLEYAPRLVQQWAHAGPVRMAMFSHQGDRVVTASEDGTARVWSVASGGPLTPPLQHGDAVVFAEFSPDGRWIVTASEDGTAGVWDSETGAQERSLAHETAVFGAALSFDGRRLVTTEVDALRLWDPASGRLVAVLSHPRVFQVSSLASFDREGRRFVSSSEDWAQVWDAETGEPSGPRLRAPGGVGPSSATLSPDGSTVLIPPPLDGRCASLWDAVTGERWSVELCHEAPVWDACFNTAGQAFTWAGREWRLWDLVTGRELERLALPTDLRFTMQPRDGRRLLTGTGAGEAFVSDVSGRRRLGPLRHAGAVTWVEHDLFRRYLVTASADGTARLWDLAAAAPEGPRMTGDAELQTIWLPPDEARTLAITGVAGAGPRQTGYLQLWDHVTGEPVTLPLRHGGGLQDWRSAMQSFSPDGRRLVSAGPDGAVRVWSAESSEPLLDLSLGEEGSAAAFSPDGALIATGGAARGSASPSAIGAGVARIRDAATGAISVSFDHSEPVSVVVFSPRGDRLLVYGQGEGGWLRLWDVASGEPLGAAWRAVGAPSFSPFSADGRWLLTAGEAGAQVWSVTGAPRTGGFGSGANSQSSAWFAPDAERVATAGPGRTVQLWEAATGRPLGPPLAAPGDVVMAPFSFDGRWLLGAGYGVGVWDVATGGLLGVVGPRSWLVTAEKTGAFFLPDGRGVLLGEIPHDNRASTWTFEREDRPVEEVVRLASLLTGQRLSPEGGTVALDREELERLWESLKAEDPDGFSVPAEKVVAWHRREAEDLAAEGRHEEALEHFDVVIEQGPPRATVFADRGHARAELGQFALAEADFVRAAELRPGFPDLWNYAALVRSVQGDEIGQRQVCSDLLRDWGTTQNPDRAYWIARTCALVPGEAAVDRELPVRLAELALPLSGLDAEMLDLRGAVLYRAGRYEEAREQLVAAVESRGGAATSWEGSFLAMVHARLEQSRAALEWLERGASAPLTPAPGPNGELRPWKDRLETEALLAEARARLEGRRSLAVPR